MGPALADRPPASYQSGFVGTGSACQVLSKRSDKSVGLEHGIGVVAPGAINSLHRGRARAIAFAICRSTSCGRVDGTLAPALRSAPRITIAFQSRAQLGASAERSRSAMPSRRVGGPPRGLASLRWSSRHDHALLPRAGGLQAGALRAVGPETRADRLGGSVRVASNPFCPVPTVEGRRRRAYPRPASSRLRPASVLRCVAAGPGLLRCETRSRHPSNTFSRRSRSPLVDGL